MDEMIDEVDHAGVFAENSDAYSDNEDLSADGFAQLALSHEATLWRSAWRLTRDRVAAEDLVQETFLRALNARHGFRLRDFGMRPWLLRILRNLYLSRRATDARRPIPMSEEQLDCVPSTSSAATVSAILPDGRPSRPALEVMDQELAGAILELPPAHQAVLMLWAVEGLTYGEVAAAVQSPPGTVMSRLHRARGRLARRLAGYAENQGIIGRNGRGTATMVSMC